MKSIALLLCLLFVSPHPFAAGLEEFESDVTTPSARNAGHSSSSGYNRSRSINCDTSSGCVGDELANSLFSGLVEIAGVLIVEGGRMSLTRIGDNPPLDDLQPRLAGEPLLPFIRLDSHYQNASDGVSAVDLKLELGYALAGLGLRRTRFWEPGTQLSLDYLHALYRMSLGSNVGFNIGLGRAVLKGRQEHSGSSITFPLLIHWSDSVGLEGSYTSSHINGNSLTDKEVALLVSLHPASLSLGYRAISGPGSTIHGPFAGFSIRW